MDNKSLCKRHFYRVHRQEQAFVLLNFIIGKEQKMKIVRLGFVASEEKLVGHDRTVYTDYYVLKK